MSITRTNIISSLCINFIICYLTYIALIYLIEFVSDGTSTLYDLPGILLGPLIFFIITIFGYFCGNAESYYTTISLLGLISFIIAMIFAFLFPSRTSKIIVNFTLSFAFLVPLIMGFVLSKINLLTYCGP